MTRPFLTQLPFRNSVFYWFSQITIQRCNFINEVLTYLCITLRIHYFYIIPNRVATVNKSLRYY